jgi:hypothetical protein
MSVNTAGKESLGKILLKSKILLNGFEGFEYDDFHLKGRNLSLK